MVRGPICVQLLRIVHMRRARGVPGDVRAARFRVVYRKGELSNREKLGMDQVFLVWTSKSGLNQMGLVF